MWQKILLVSTFACALSAQKFRVDDPLEKELRPIPVVEAARRKLSDYYDAIRNTVSTPGDIRSKTPAQGTNTLGEPMQGAWWVKRHYYDPMSLDKLVAGPGQNHAPSLNGSWTVIGAKTEGVTPGFVMKDSANELYFIKFDPITYPEMATGADHVSVRLLYALGYHVPENYLVEFPQEILKLGKDVTVADRLGRRRKLTERHLRELLQKVPRTKKGMYRATASHAIPGTGLGPYRYYGKRRDDPNDYVPHEHRRDLRGLAVISAWIGHDDSRAINTYDTLVDGQIRHYILDVGSTLGSGTQWANSPRSGGEYLFSWKNSAIQFFSLGLAVQPWARAYFPDMPAAGRFEHRTFDPATWVPEYPNPAFLNRLPDDEFWAAKQIAAFRDDEIRAIVRSASYSHPNVEAWIAECLIARRDKIGRAYFRKVLPIDKVAIQDGRLTFVDVSERAGLGGGGPYAVQWLQLDNAKGSMEPIDGAGTAVVPGGKAEYVVARIMSSSRAKQTVDVTVRRDGRNPPTVVGIERRW